MSCLVLRRSLLSASLLASLSPAVQAADGSTLPDVVVTATRNEVPREKVLAAVTVLDRAAIERSQAADILELLGRQPGIDIVRTGGPGSLSTLNTRGGNSNHTLVLIDGLRVNSSVQGLFDLAHLPLAQVERIEIVRGPRAALWGSDAIGGVVQVFTRDASSFAELRAGSYGHGAADAGLSLGTDTRFGMSAGVESLEGFSASDYDADRDGYTNRHVALRLSVPLGSHRLTGQARASDADVEYDEGESDVRDWQGGLRLVGELRAGWNHEVVLGHSVDRVDSTSQFYDYAFASARDSVDWLHRFTPATGQVLQVGVNWSREDGSAEDSFLGQNYDLDRRNTGLFATWSGERGAHRGELSLRHDDNSQFGGATTANAAWGWQPVEALRVRASWGQGFRAPNFNELYYPGFSGDQGERFFAGTDSLSPERSHSVELGLDWQPAAAHALGLSLYRTRVRDMIVFEEPDTNNAINIDRANLEGAELEYHWQGGAWTFAGNAGWQRAENDSSGLALLRRAPRKAHASLDRRLRNGALVGVDVDALAARPDMDFDTYPAPPARIDLAGYGLVHLRVAMPLRGGWQLEARVENLFDRDYELAHAFNTPGRSGMVAVRWRNGE
ncbi:MAG: TonB-dependent receptor domain-containing protein [Arenimonas sp.]